MQIAFIGLGNMGGGMAANLVKAGHAVRAFDLSAEALDRAKANGCETFEAANFAVHGADAVVTMLPNGKLVRDVYEEAIFSTAEPGTLLLDCSTIDVQTAREVGQSALAYELAMVDAPVSGGIAAANAGTLTFMVGGNDAAFAAAQPILSAMGKAVIHAGSLGAGQAAKICNNMALGIHMLGTCEAFAMAGKLGLDPARFYDIISVSSGQSWSVTSYCPVAGVGPASPADNGFQPGFAAALMLKDLKLAMEAAQTAGASVPIGEKARDIYEAFVAAGHGNVDFSGVIRDL